MCSKIDLGNVQLSMCRHSGYNLTSVVSRWSRGASLRLRERRQDRPCAGMGRREYREARNGTFPSFAAIEANVRCRQKRTFVQQVSDEHKSHMRSFVVPNVRPIFGLLFMSAACNIALPATKRTRCLLNLHVAWQHLARRPQSGPKRTQNFAKALRAAARIH